MASTSPGYGITIRVEGSPDSNPVALATTVITSAGATITALDVVESLLEKVVIDITCDTVDADHAEEITSATSSLILSWGTLSGAFHKNVSNSSEASIDIAKARSFGL